MTMFYEKLLEVSDSSHVKTEEKMSRHTTFRVGGPAAYYVSPADARELGEVIRLCRREEVPYCILGNGSNLLVGDGGFDGVVISMTAGFSGCRVRSRLVREHPFPGWGRRHWRPGSQALNLQPESLVRWAEPS